MRVRSRGEGMKLKQYKLKRDLPTFKAGDEFIICCGNLIEVKPDGTLGVCAYSGNTLKKFPDILTDWFEEVKEPLIKDEKIRKAVRAWAEANKYDKLWIHHDDTAISFYNEDDDENEIIFNTMEKFGLEHLKCYTINELCGENDR